MVLDAYGSLARAPGRSRNDGPDGSAMRARGFAGRGISRGNTSTAKFRNESFGVARSRAHVSRGVVVNPDGRLKPGFLLQASIPSAKEEKTIFFQSGGELSLWRLQSIYGGGNRVSEENRFGQRAKTKMSAAGALKVPRDEAGQIAGPLPISGDLQDGRTGKERSEEGTPALK